MARLAGPATHGKGVYVDGVYVNDGCRLGLMFADQAGSNESFNVRVMANRTKRVARVVSRKRTSNAIYRSFVRLEEIICW